MIYSPNALEIDRLNNRFNAYWEARAASDFDIMLEILVDIKGNRFFQSVSTSPIEDLPKHLVQLEEPIRSLCVEAIVCTTGYDRIKLDGSTSENLTLIKIFELVRDIDLSNSARFSLYFEMGCLLFSENSFSKSLDCFVISKQHASSTLKLYISSLQCLNCDNLLRTSSSKSHLDARKYASSLELELHGTAVCDKILLPYKIYSFKDHFFNSQLGKWIQTENHTDALLNSYEFNWTLSLPYCNLDTLMQRTIACRLDGIRAWTHYQRRTLLGQWDSIDALPNNSTLIIERIYLWTWRWLQDPDLRTIEKINLTFQSLDLSERIKISQNHLAMLKNSVLWISVFGDDQFPEINRFGKYIYRDIPEAPHTLSLENKVISYLSARFDQSLAYTDDLLNEIQKLVKINSELSFLGKLVCESECTSEGHGFIHHKPKAAFKIKVNLRNMTIQSLPIVDEKNGRINSESLCRVLILLRIYGKVSYELFSRFVFDTNKFQHGSHERQIFNLIARVRKLFSDKTNLEIVVRKGQIAVSGNWNQIKFEEEQRLVQTIIGIEENLSHSSDLKKIGVVISKASFKDRLFEELTSRNQDMFTRRDIQHFLNISKSSAGRLLKQLVEKKEIRCVKKGPNATYNVVAKKPD